VQVTPVGSYSSATKQHLYGLDKWAFEGRVSITNQSDSWTANIDWQHFAGKEKIRLSGPLGQGATVIDLADDFVTIDHGGGNKQSSRYPEAFIGQQVGLYVPVQSLRFWVVGVPELEGKFEEIGNGFVQDGWLIEYQQMQAVAKESLPRKITVKNDKVKLKLVIDQWVINDVNVR
jgi:outer membrane lipoprotein LolB